MRTEIMVIGDCRHGFPVTVTDVERGSILKRREVRVCCECLVCTEKMTVRRWSFGIQ